MGSGLTFRTLIHLGFIFVHDIRKCPSLISLHVAVQISQSHLLKRLFFSIVYSGFLCHRLIDHRWISLFLDSLFCSVVLRAHFCASTMLLWLLSLLMLMFSHSVASDSLLLHGLQQDRLPCPSLSHSTQTHIHWVKYVIQPSHPLPPSSPFVFNLSQHKNLFQLVDSSHQVVNALELQLQHQSFQWIFRIDFL